jgi:hypothetical protein
MVAVIGQRAAGFGMNEDGDAVPVKGKPRDDVDEQPGLEGELIAPAQMGAGRRVVPVPTFTSKVSESAWRRAAVAGCDASS